MHDRRGVITDIQRFSLHDGPGIRTTVFLKGCNLRCAWCHNPETIDPQPVIQFMRQRCIACGACIKVCPNGMPEDWRAVCAACGACAEECPAGARIRVGRSMTVSEVLRAVLADRAFYETSGGGITLSGGEPLFQAAFAMELLARAKAERLHTAIETNLDWPWETIAPLLPLLDLVLLDIKTLDEDTHVEQTGAGNRRLLANVRRLAETGRVFIARTPVVPGVNDTDADIERIAAFLAPLAGLLHYELLPFHPLGAGKYEGVGLSYPAAGTKRPERTVMDALAAAARTHGLTVKVG